MLDVADFTIGWICALPTEFAAAQALLDEKYDKNELELVSHNDDNSYELGRIGKHKIVVAVLPSYGLVNAATVAKDLARTFPNIRLALMVGVGGGAPSKKNDIRLGDVVVSCRGDGHGGVIQYDLGRTLQNGGFQRTGSLNQPPQALLAALRSLQAHHDLVGHDLEAIVEAAFKRFPRLRRKYTKPDPSTDRLYHSHIVHTRSGACDDSCSDNPDDLISRSPRDADEDDPAIFYGLIASANTVMKDAYQRDKLAAEEGVLCFEMEAAGLMNNIPCLVVRGISDYCDSHKQKSWQGYAALMAAAYAKELLGKVSAIQVNQEVPFGKLLVSVNETLNEVQGQLAQTHITIDNLHTQLDLSKLPCATGASFDSQLPEYNALCLEHTRTELLEEIMTWVSDKDSKPIFWLSGMAGTGKSTLARTIANHLESSGKLGASFFFKRGEGDRAHAERFFTTIARDLCTREPGVVPSIRESLEENPKISETLRKDQFEKLILEPLLNLEQGSVRVIVIDALDECSQEDQAREILRQLARASQISPMPLRVLVTSRPEMHIHLGFGAMLGGTYRDLILHEVDKNAVRHDLELFIQNNLQKIRDERELDKEWPGKAQITSLVELAAPLFIYASFVCGYIGTKTGNPETQLRKIIDLGKSTFGQLDQVYLQVLQELLAEQDADDQQEWLADFRRIVGTVVVLQNPLSIQSLARLLRRSTKDLQLRLQSFRSVLHIPDRIDEPVRMLHLSFRDTLVSSRRKADDQFWIDETETHKMLARDCILLMRSALRENICHLASRGTFTTEIPSQTIETHLPPGLQYACLYWIDHLCQSGERLEEQDETSLFLRAFVLNWLEVMGIIGESSRCVHLLEKLLFIVSEDGSHLTEVSSIPPSREERLTPNSISSFLRDAVRFVLKFNTPLADAPLQIYESGLLFSPTNSLIQQTFSDQTQMNWKFLTPRPEDWEISRSLMEGHERGVNCVDFSPDGSLVASGSNDAHVRLWETQSGICRAVLSGHEHRIQRVDFSPNGQFLASADYVYPRDYERIFWDTSTIRIWEVATGTCRTVLNDRPRLGVFKFSPNGKLIAILSKHEGAEEDFGGRFAHRFLDGSSLQIFDVETGTPFNVVSDSLQIGCLNDLCFSPDSQMLVLVSFHALCIYKISTGTSQIIEDSPEGTVVTLERWSQQFRVALTAMKEGCARTWKLTSSVCRSLTFAVPEKKWLDASLSPDGTLLAATSFAMGEFSVFLWDVDSNSRCSATPNYKYLHKMKDELYEGLIFSPSGSYAASKRSGKLLVLDTSGQRLLKLIGHSQAIKDAKFSPCGRLLVTASGDSTLRLWDLRSSNGDSRDSSRFHRVRLCVLSPNGSLLALAFSNGEIQLWDTVTANIFHKVPGNIVVNSMMFSANSHLHVATRHGVWLRTWSIGEKNLSLTAEYQLDWADEVEFIAKSTEGSMLVLSCQNDIIDFDKNPEYVVWDGQTGVIHPIFRIGKSEEISAIELSPPGATVAFGTKAYELILQDVQTGARLGTLSGHTDAIRDITFANVAHSNLIASASLDSTIRIWSIATGRCRSIIYDDDAGLVATAFSKNAKLLASVNDNNTIRLWDVDTACCLATRHESSAWVKGFNGLSPLDEVIEPHTRSRLFETFLWRLRYSSLFRRGKLTFAKDDNFLQWDHATLPIPYELLEGQWPHRKKRPTISFESPWVICDSLRLTWLPFETRPDEFISGKGVHVIGRTIAIVPRHATPTILELVDSE